MDKIMEKKFKQRERYEEMGDDGRANRIAIPLAMNKVPATKHGDYYEEIAMEEKQKKKAETKVVVGQFKTVDTMSVRLEIADESVRKAFALAEEKKDANFCRVQGARDTRSRVPLSSASRHLPSWKSRRHRF